MIKKKVLTLAEARSHTHALVMANEMRNAGFATLITHLVKDGKRNPTKNQDAMNASYTDRDPFLVHHFVFCFCSR